MRTTVDLDSDVAAAVERLRADRGVGLSEAVNLLARKGLAAREERSTYVHRTSDLGMKVDVTNIGDVLDFLDGPQ